MKGYTLKTLNESRTLFTRLLTKKNPASPREFSNTLLCPTLIGSMSHTSDDASEFTEQNQTKILFSYFHFKKN